MTAAHAADPLVEFVQELGAPAAHTHPTYRNMVSDLREKFAESDTDLNQALRDLPEGSLRGIARDVVSRSTYRRAVADIEHIPNGFRLYTRRGGVVDVSHVRGRISVRFYPASGQPVSRWSGIRADAVERLRNWLTTRS